MVKVLSGCVYLVALAAARPASAPAPFSGCIVYEHEYQTLAGDPLFFAVKPKSWFYVQGSNLKVYDRNQQLQELYLGATNEYHRYEKGPAGPRAAAATRPMGAATRTCLASTATILGYQCQALQLTQEGTSTLVFYAPALRVNAAEFSRCPSPGFYTLLQATDGALPLRTIMVDTRRDVTTHTEAIEVRPLVLAAAEFAVGAPVR
jgi:hypothetical protein